MADQLGKTVVNLVQSPGRLTSASKCSAQQLAMTARYAKQLLGCYRTGDANDPEVYTDAIIRVMSAYSEDILIRITDPLTGLPSKLEWLPKPAEVLKACEEIEGPRRRAREWEQRAQEQLAERKALEGGPRKIPQHMLDELAANGLLAGHEKQYHGETPGKVMAKYGLSQTQWDALPNSKSAA